MPINIKDDLPAVKILNDENIFVMTNSRANLQDIRPLEIVILNLMPMKIQAETQLFRLLGNSALQVNITLLHPETHTSKHTDHQYLEDFYKTFSQVKDQYFDGMIITGAPVELLPYESVNYWPELEKIMSWTLSNVYSTLHICWGAFAGLYYHYGVPKHPLDKKAFGVFEHTSHLENLPLFRGFDDVYYAPHSRYTEIKTEDLTKVPELTLAASSKEVGVYIVLAKEGRQIFVTGHSEYDSHTLKLEYERDIQLGKPIDVPKNYFKNDNPKSTPIVNWRSHANLFFGNWLNYYVYQETPYDIRNL